MRFIVTLHRTIDFLFCDRCPYNVLDSWPAIFGCGCPATYFWELYERLHLWEEPYRKVKYMWPASVFGQKMSKSRRKDDEEMREVKLLPGEAERLELGSGPNVAVWTITEKWERGGT